VSVFSWSGGYVDIFHYCFKEFCLSRGMFGNRFGDGSRLKFIG